MTLGGDEESPLPEKQQRVVTPAATENDPWLLDRLRALCKSDIAAFAVHELAICSANPSLVGDGPRHAAEGAFTRRNMELLSSSLVDSVSTLTDAKLRSAQQNTATAREEFFESQLVKPQKDELLFDFLAHVKRTNEGERLRPTSSSSGLAGKEPRSRKDGLMEPDERVALPPVVLPLGSPVALPPVYFYGKIPKGEGRDGKEYQKEMEAERSKPHWSELMNNALHITSEQTRQGRRVNLKEAAQTLVMAEPRRQCIHKDHDKSSPNKRKETVLDTRSATDCLHEKIKKFRKKRNRASRSSELDVDCLELELDELDVDNLEHAGLLQFLGFDDAPDTVWGLGLPTDDT